MKLNEQRQWITAQLEDVINFWLKNGMDPVHGGIYTCISEESKVFSTDKSVWMQGRCGWIFSYLCHVYGVKQQWLDAAKSCLDFMEDHCIHPENGRMYFTVAEDGTPLRQRRYYYSEAFYCMANAEYYGVTGKAEHLERARKAYDIYYNLCNGGADPVGLPPKSERPGRSLGLPMILLNVTSIMLRVDPANAALYLQRGNECVHDIFAYHVKPELGCTLENVAPDGSTRLNVTEGRIVNPGHDIECSWFLLEWAKIIGDETLAVKARQIFDMAFEMGWDKEYGGILYFTDCLGQPPESYEHDMKLWWPHNEALIASLMLYRDTKEEKYRKIFDQLLDYCSKHFASANCGEWYGYLRRDGKPTLPACIGSTFKGPFHVPRCLILLDQIIKEMNENE